jgi:hypothetical protein
MYVFVFKGRSGKGVVYVFAGGNGGFDDNCNTDGYVNSIYTIGINSVTIDNEYPGYAEPCAAILASAYSGNAVNDMVNMLIFIGKKECKHSPFIFHCFKHTCKTSKLFC